MDKIYAELIKRKVIAFYQVPENLRIQVQKIIGNIEE